MSVVAKTTPSIPSWPRCLYSTINRCDVCLLRQQNVLHVVTFCLFKKGELKCEQPLLHKTTQVTSTLLSQVALALLLHLRILLKNQIN